MDIGTRKQLLVDDYVVEDTWNLKRVVTRPAKHHANPVLRADQPWEHSNQPGQSNKGLHGNSVMYDRDEGLFKLWYNSSHFVHWNSPEDCTYTYWIGYATSRDGIVWEKPDVGSFEFDGSTANNVVLTGEWWATCGTVLKEDAEPDPARRYKLLYTDIFGVKAPEKLVAQHRAGELRAGVCIAYSPDGVHWTPHADNPVIDGESDTMNTVFWDERLQRYVLYLRPPVYAGRWKRRVARAESPDLLRWSYPQTVVTPDELDPVEVYGMPVFPYEGLYFGLLQMYYSDTSMTIDSQLAFSRDGTLWDRLPTRQTFIERGIEHGQAREFDCGMLFPLPPVPVGDELWFYYTGHNVLHNDSGAQESAVGLATLKRDRFIARTPVRQSEGALVTRAFTCEGDGLEINACAANGRIRVEVLTERGEVVEGFGRGECAAFAGDALAHSVRWNGGGLSALRGRTIRLKFYLSEASLYAFQITDRA